MVTTLVVAMAENRVIGRDNALPWHLPADLAHFKRVTMGKPVVMGRRTWESIGRALPGRLNVVVSASGAVSGECTVVTSFAAALRACGDAPEVCVIGGARVFADALPRADRIHLTIVHAEVDGDVHFPALAGTDWTETARERREPDERNAHAMSFIELQRSTSRNAELGIRNHSNVVD